MNGIRAWWAVSSVLAIAFLLAAPGPASAKGQASVTYSDPVGDPILNAIGGSADYEPPAYQDLVKSSITKQDMRFTFFLEVAARIPARPALSPPGNSQIWWAWLFELDPATAPQGYPAAPGTSHITELNIVVAWDGVAFTGFVIDRRPLLIGLDAAIVPITFTIKGATISTTLSATLLDLPSAFLWVASTWLWSSDPGTEALKIMDFGPDFPPGGTWPA